MGHAGQMENPVLDLPLGIAALHTAFVVPQTFIVANFLAASQSSAPATRYLQLSTRPRYGQMDRNLAAEGDDFVNFHDFLYIG